MKSFEELKWNDKAAIIGAERMGCDPMTTALYMSYEIDAVLRTIKEYFGKYSN